MVFARERDVGHKKEGQDTVPTILQACQNYPFLLYLLTQIKDTIILQEVYAYKWIFLLNKDQVFFSFLTTYGVSFLSSLVWTKFGIENKYGAMLGYITAVLSSLIVLLMPQEDEGATYLFLWALAHSFVEGIGVGARNIFCPAMAADCIEYDQLRHGNRRFQKNFFLLLFSLTTNDDDDDENLAANHLQSLNSQNEQK